MERTPSPPRRIHTPPAPGTSYEPFSPRRSSRVAAQRDAHLHHEQPAPRTRRAVTPTASSKPSIVRAANLALSPPSSPVSPQHHARSPRSTRRTRLETADSDCDHAAPTPARRFLSAMPSDMLPTPVKTPRKRQIGDLSSTSRILFPQRPATIEEVVPTPRKSRKTKNLFTLESFSAHMDEESEKIPIFTDSKERIPTPGAPDENPFLTPKKGKGRAKTTRQKSTKETEERTARLNEAAKRDEGMVYIFRGKKILRRFHNGQSDEDSAPEDDQELSADERAMRRQVGYEAHRPLTRSSVKPKLLFQKEIQERKIANGEEEDDEEAVTDIEVPVPATPSRKKGKAVASEPMLATTPPPTVRKLRKEISFDSWSRVKSSSRSSSQPSKKRSGEVLERETGDKRARTRS
ncbi:hypothetical protein LEMA_P060750.1 [Plenodomus lingam JN3]|uniref:Uncharacterized protein n=1 Tax=Leptosphaeria maculans (strain JN3 / isolate v23.1.3 / race Av1-4-5-6-7-8) TaxID=985895 RepID=E4ZIM0_LEPMJ|nr:hypothetical protein LEMA_P060750.1 [Plenodomus lingam JN3]CBX91041.1 hypothetical protein LEMA_P060750.1 [Plenodomus lingam JN3]